MHYWCNQRLYRSALEKKLFVVMLFPFQVAVMGRPASRYPGILRAHHRLLQLLSDPALRSLVKGIAFFTYLDELNVILHTCDGSTARLLSESSALRTCVGFSSYTYRCACPHTMQRMPKPTSVVLTSDVGNTLRVPWMPFLCR